MAKDFKQEMVDVRTKHKALESADRLAKIFMTCEMCGKRAKTAICPKCVPVTYVPTHGFDTFLAEDKHDRVLPLKQSLAIYEADVEQLYANSY